MFANRRSTRVFCALLAASLGVTISSAARAQSKYAGEALDTFDPAERGSDWFNLDSLDFRGHVRGAIGVTFDEGYKPLVAYGPNGASSNLVENQLFAHLGASLILFERLRLAFNLPIALYQNGTATDVAGTIYGGPPHPAGIGDLRLGADLRLVGQYGDPFSMAIGLQVFTPTGSQSGYDGDGKVRLSPHLLIAGQAGAFVYAARVAYVWRPNDTPIDFEETGSELQAGLSLGVRLVDNKLTIGPEVYGATSTWSGATLFTEATSPLEGILGVHYQLGDFKIGGGAGPGFTRGFGAPEVRGLLSFEWAPVPSRDRDNDGVPDDQDACPDTFGVHTNDPKTNGCPAVIDSDGDGIPDSQDACPNVAGVRSDDPKTNGCPAVVDTDGDGIPDSQDACPTVAGLRTDDPKTNGCPPPPPPPDQDKDGIPDAQDACPIVPGVPTSDPKTNGCPKDTDADGVPDAIDNCPTEPGPAANQGCPVQKKQLVVITKNKLEIHDRVYFQSGKAAIQKRSFGLLDQIAAVLTAHPEIARVLIEGHTDNVGRPETNRKLSQGRAESVKAYLVRKGIDSVRLEAQGFGPDQPIDSNATAAGKANNRRVEFKIRGSDDTPTPAPLQ